MSWLAWLLPLGFFWPIAAIWLGGLIEVRGGSPARQLLGLLAGFGVFLLVWWGLGRVLMPVGPVLGGVLLPTALALAAMPVLLWTGYRIVGLPLERSVAH
jgi:hypothetical protein